MWYVLCRSPHHVLTDTQVAAGVPKSQKRDDHAQALVELGLRMLKTADRYKLQLKIGINSGEVTAGVLGDKARWYHLFGVRATPLLACCCSDKWCRTR